MLVRKLESELIAWKNKENRFPIILRGARQVGKSYLVEKRLAEQFQDCFTVNFEKEPKYRAIFQGSLDPKNILSDLQTLSRRRIVPGKTLLFFDEAQSCPEAILSLRYFYEELPELHLLATGSLLEFALEKISVPVGRVEYKYLYPLTFEEFLINSKEEIFLESIKEHQFAKPLSNAVHDRGNELLRLYLALGGMPKVIDEYLRTREDIDIDNLESVQQNLLLTYRDDFTKYAKRASELDSLELVFSRVPHIACETFTFTKISREIRSAQIRNAIDLLAKASVVSKIYKASQLPLAAKHDAKRYKLLFLDVGLMQRASGQSIASWLTEKETYVHSGSVAEQFVGQEILAYSKRDKMLFYWERANKASSAEVDYLLEIDRALCPVEVKSGKTGRLKSLLSFMQHYPKAKQGLKVSTDNFSLNDKIQSVPLYAFGQWLDKMSS